MRTGIITFACMLLSVSMHAQVINFTPAATTILVTVDTTVGIGGGNFRTFLVCPGVTLSYAESSSMDTILLEAGAIVKFDSAFSYGYASVYAKSGSTVDMNFRQTGKLTYVNGVTVLDSNIGPPSFFMGSHLVNTINYDYSNLPGGAPCSPTQLQAVEQQGALISLFNTEHELIVQNSGPESILDVRIYSFTGQLLMAKKLHEIKNTLDISALPPGIYRLVWNQHGRSGSAGFTK